MSEGFRLTLELDEEIRARWQLAADRIGYPRLDTWARDTLDAASDPDAGRVVDLLARLSDAETERDQWKATAETLGDAEVMADLRAADAEELGSNETGAKPGGEGLSTPLPSLSDEGLVAKLFAAEARVEALERERDELRAQIGGAWDRFAAQVRKVENREEILIQALREIAEDKAPGSMRCATIQKIARAALSAGQPDE